MYKQKQHLRYTDGNQCPECFKIGSSYRLHIFKSVRALKIHLVRSHDLERTEKEKIFTLLNDYKEGSFIDLCFQRGVLY